MCKEREVRRVCPIYHERLKTSGSLESAQGLEVRDNKELRVYSVTAGLTVNQSPSWELQAD